MHSVISIGCQIGGPEPCSIGDLKVLLCRLLAAHVTSTHCSAIDEYALVLRVDGSLDKFGSEGLARLRFAKARRYITLDIQIPEAVWKPMSEVETRQYLVKQVGAAIAACIGRLVKDRYTVHRLALQGELDTAFAEYLSLQANTPVRR